MTFSKKHNNDDVLCHYGIKGQKWGIRQYQNEDGSLTEAGKKRYGADTTTATAKQISRFLNDIDKASATYAIDAARYNDRVKSEREKYARYQDKKTEYERKMAEKPEKAEKYKKKIDKIASEIEINKRDFEEYRSDGYKALAEFRKMEALGDKAFKEAERRGMTIRSKNTVRGDASGYAGERLYLRADKNDKRLDTSRAGAQMVNWTTNGTKYKVKDTKKNKKQRVDRNGFTYGNRNVTKHLANYYYY